MTGLEDVIDDHRRTGAKADLAVEYRSRHHGGCVRLGGPVLCAMARTASFARSQSPLSGHDLGGVLFFPLRAGGVSRRGAGLSAGGMVDRHGDLRGRPLRWTNARIQERRSPPMTKIIVDGAE